MRSREEQRQQRQQEDKLFAELWEADRQAKEERERQRVQRQQHRDAEQLDALNAQTEAAERQRQQDRQLRDEEARLLVRTAPSNTYQYINDQYVAIWTLLDRLRHLNTAKYLALKCIAPNLCSLNFLLF